jgi:hypothetical protein
MAAKKNFFTNYPADIWIETGTYFGDGISEALEAGYEKVVSIELSDYYYEIAKRRFESDKRVFVHHGHSCKVLPGVLRDCSLSNKKAVLWLDAHYSACGTAGIEDPNPLMNELAIIKDLSVALDKRLLPTIIVDDLRTFDKNTCGFDINDIIHAIRAISHEYVFSFHDGCNAPSMDNPNYKEFRNDILVANI